MMPRPLMTTEYLITQHACHPSLSRSLKLLPSTCCSSPQGRMSVGERWWSLFITWSIFSKIVTTGSFAKLPVVTILEKIDHGCYGLTFTCRIVVCEELNVVFFGKGRHFRGHHTTGVQIHLVYAWLYLQYGWQCRSDSITHKYNSGTLNSSYMEYSKLPAHYIKNKFKFKFFIITTGSICSVSFKNILITVNNFNKSFQWGSNICPGPSCFELDQYGEDCISIVRDSSCTRKQ